MLTLHIDAFHKATSESTVKQLFGQFFGPTFKIDDVNYVIHNVARVTASKTPSGALVALFDKLFNQTGRADYLASIAGLPKDLEELRQFRTAQEHLELDGRTLGHYPVNPPQKGG